MAPEYAHAVRALLTSLEEGNADLPTSLAYLAGTAVELDEHELRAALRRAELLLAAGGDPHRELEPDGRAVTALAADLDAEPARAQLRDGLERLAAEADGLSERLCGARRAARRRRPGVAHLRLRATRRGAGRLARLPRSRG